MTVRRAALLAANIAILAAFAVFIGHRWSWQRLLTPWRDIPPAWLVAATAAQLASYGLRALRIYLAEADIPRGRYLSCLRLILINNALNLLLPMRSGEASFPILMNRWFGINAAHATGTLIWLRVLDLHVLATIGLLCVTQGWLATAAVSAAVGVGASCAVAAPLLLFVLRAPLTARCQGSEALPARLLRRLLAGLPVRRRGLAIDLLLTWSAWSVKLAALGWLLASLARLPIAAAILGAIGGDLTSVLPIYTPGGFGVYEGGVLGALAVAQAPSPSLLTAAVNLHLFVLTVAMLAGAAAWLAGSGRRPQQP